MYCDATLDSDNTELYYSDSESVNLDSEILYYKDSALSEIINIYNFNCNLVRLMLSTELNYEEILNNLIKNT